jgi:predicted DNA-binding transcriptional regulator YafY
MAISKTQRWLDLIAFLVRHHFPVDVDQVMNGVPAYRGKWNSGEEKDKQTVRRTFERDKDELRSAGIPLETREYTIDHGAEVAVGYQLAARDFYLPYLRLVGREAEAAEGRRVGRGSAPANAMEIKITGDEAATAIEALRRVADLPASPFAREARSALRKLGFDIDLAALGESPVVYADQVEPRMAAEDHLADAAFAQRRPLHRDTVKPGGVAAILRLLTRALRERTRVRFRYRGIHRGEATERDVAPYGLLYQHGQWYLIGSDAMRDDAIRVFRLGRMEAQGAGKATSPEYDIPSDFDLSDYTRRQPWELGDDEPYTAHVRFDFPISLWADRNRHGDQVEELPGGATLRRFRVRQTDPFLRWLQQFGGEAIVTHPPGLCQAQAEMARETLEAYGV